MPHEFPPAPATDPTENTLSDSERENSALATATSTDHALPAREDASHAAQQLVERYLSITDSITERGGKAPEEMSPVVTEDWLRTEYQGFVAYQQQQIRTIGRTTLTYSLLQSVRRLPDDGIELALFGCVDSTSVWVIPVDSPEPPEGLLDWLQSGSPAEEDHAEPPESWVDYQERVSPRTGHQDPLVIWLEGEDLGTLRIASIDSWRGHHPCLEQ